MNAPRKKTLIFDVDGVLIDSKLNMQLSWQEVQKNFNLKNKKFDNYFKLIGRPFYDILNLMGIKKNHKEIKKIYQKESIIQSSTISFYKDAEKVLKTLYKEKFILNILTSKDLKRTRKFLKNSKKYFKFIECNNEKIKGKPNPDQINLIVDKLNVKKSECVYIGDTHIDYLTAKNSNIDFIFAVWGYGNSYNYKYRCKNIKDLPTFIKTLSN